MAIRLYWCQDQVSQNRFCVYWKSRKVNLGDYYSKHHTKKHHHMVRPIYLNENNSPRDIPTNAAVGLRGCVDSDQLNTQTINPNILTR